MTHDHGWAVKTLLHPVSLAWRGAVAARNALYDRGLARVERLPAPVISVGNITLGGTGKTPLVIHLAGALLARGILPLVLSRGYRSRGHGTRVVADREGVRLDPRAGGDEPVLIARKVAGLPVVVDPDRVRGGREGITRFGPAVILLDDGFQHRRLFRDLDVVLLDAVDPFGRDALLPAGRLREPCRGLERADVFVITHAADGDGIETLTSVLGRYQPGASIVRARHRAVRLRPLSVPPGPHPAGDDGTGGPSGFAGPPMFAFCGVGSPHGFRTTLLDAGAHLVGFEAFDDHHEYSAGDLAGIAAAAERAGAEIVVTTEKDAVRIPEPPRSPPFCALEIRMELDPPDLLTDRILEIVRSRPAGPEAGG